MEAPIIQLRKELKAELIDDILPFWMERMQDSRGGFYGRIDNNNVVHPESPKGAVLNARILWTFSSAWRLLKKPEYLLMAQRAKEEVTSKFIDSDYGGVYWTIDAYGKPCDTKKQTYATAFAIYGLSEYARATGDEESLQCAIRLYRDIETHCADNILGGYFEAFNRQWGRQDDMRLGTQDANACKTMNTHLHILEAYTNLYRVWRNETLAEKIRLLIAIFREKILNSETARLRLFFDADWKPYDDKTSFGHDIEASWLLYESVKVLDDNSLESEMKPLVYRMAFSANSDEDANVEICRLPSAQWWEYAEAVVGYYNVWQLFANHYALGKALCAWDYVKKHLIDSEQGEWYWGVDANGIPLQSEDKAGLWKCPYHNGRMCMELLQRVEE